MSTSLLGLMKYFASGPFSANTMSRALFVEGFSQLGPDLDRMRQYAHADENAPVLIVTHTTDPQSIEKALANVPKTGVVHDKPVALRIEPL